MKREYIYIIVAAFFIILFFSTTVDLERTNVDIIPIKGEIHTQRVSQGLFATTLSSTEIIQNIEQSAQDPRIKAIILEIDSPGGTPVASHEVVKAIKEADKPVVAWIRESGASGAYWIASAADYVISDELSITGSVGVYASYLEFSGLLARYNVTYEQITGGELKALGDPFKELGEFEREVLEEKILLMHNFFLEDVKNNRNLTAEQYEEIRKGSFYLGLEAIELGLVDELGGKAQAINYLENKLGQSIETKTKVQRTRGLNLFGVQNNPLFKLS